MGHCAHARGGCGERGEIMSGPAGRKRRQGALQNKRLRLSNGVDPSRPFAALVGRFRAWRNARRRKRLNSYIRGEPREFAAGCRGALLAAPFALAFWLALWLALLIFLP
jgi:hypothetical protein